MDSIFTAYEYSQQRTTNPIIDSNKMSRHVETKKILIFNCTSVDGLGYMCIDKDSQRELKLTSFHHVCRRKV